MLFPGGVFKALTFSYDDGVEQDVKLISIFDKHGLKATFNINSGLFAPNDNGNIYINGVTYNRMSKVDAVKLYKGGHHEISAHTYTHSTLEHLPLSTMIEEVLQDKKNLEDVFARPIRGLAYPNSGTTNDKVINVIKNIGVEYARIAESTEKFTLPNDWYRWTPTCHHNSKNLMSLAKKFVEGKNRTPQLFYLWGHSFEFDKNNNWNVIEEFVEYISNRDDIWYATNIDIYDYINAYNNLKWSTDLNSVYNPSGVPVWVKLEKANGEEKFITINPNSVFNS